MAEVRRAGAIRKSRKGNRLVLARVQNQDDASGRDEYYLSNVFGQVIGRASNRGRHYLQPPLHTFESRQCLCSPMSALDRPAPGQFGSLFPDRDLERLDYEDLCLYD